MRTRTPLQRYQCAMVSMPLMGSMAIVIIIFMQPPRAGAHVAGPFRPARAKSPRRNLAHCRRDVENWPSIC